MCCRVDIAATGTNGTFVFRLAATIQLLFDLFYHIHDCCYSGEYLRRKRRSGSIGLIGFAPSSAVTKSSDPRNTCVRRPLRHHLSTKNSAFTLAPIYPLQNDEQYVSLYIAHIHILVIKVLASALVPTQPLVINAPDTHRLWSIQPCETVQRIYQQHDRQTPCDKCLFTRK